MFTVLIIVLSFTVFASAKSNGVGLENPILEEAIREELNRPKGIITPADLMGLNSIRLSNKEMKDLKCIEYLAGLEELYVDNNYITNIDNIANLKKLKILHYIIYTEDNIVNTICMKIVEVLKLR